MGILHLVAQAFAGDFWQSEGSVKPTLPSVRNLFCAIRSIFIAYIYNEPLYQTRQTVFDHDYNMILVPLISKLKMIKT